MLIASALGLFHGFGCNLIMTISLIHGSWVGSMEWCGAAANIHKYIIYSIIYLQVVVTLEVTLNITIKLKQLCYLIEISYYQDVRQHFGQCPVLVYNYSGYRALVYIHFPEVKLLMYV